MVGPNGSGKSNMIDAMLFVFGYRAAKIRSKKVSVLIHKSDQHRDFRHCSVSVHFQKILDLVGSYCVRSVHCPVKLTQYHDHFGVLGVYVLSTHCHKYSVLFGAVTISNSKFSFNSARLGPVQCCPR